MDENVCAGFSVASPVVFVMILYASAVVDEVDENNCICKYSGNRKKSRQFTLSCALFRNSALKLQLMSNNGRICGYE